MEPEMKMSQKNDRLEKLLERYFDGRTDDAEEKELTDYFLQGTVPEVYRRYAPLFLYKSFAAFRHQDMDGHERTRAEKRQGRFKDFSRVLSGSFAAAAAAVAVTVLVFRDAGQFGTGVGNGTAGIQSVDMQSGFTASVEGVEVKDLETALSVAESGLSMLGGIDDCIRHVSENLPVGRP